MRYLRENIQVKKWIETTHRHSSQQLNVPFRTRDGLRRHKREHKQVKLFFQDPRRVKTSQKELSDKSARTIGNEMKYTLSKPTHQKMVFKT